MSVTFPARRAAVGAPSISARAAGLTRRAFQALLIAIAVALAAASVALFSGKFRLATTAGTSMLPAIHTGDVAIVERSSRYHVGDVVAYRGSLTNVPVLHRIVWTDGTSFTLKGDNNPTADPGLVRRPQIIGRSVLVVPHGHVALPSLVALVGLLLLALWFPRP